MDGELRILLLESVTAEVERIESELHHAGLHYTVRRVPTRDAFLMALDDFVPDLILLEDPLPELDSLMALRLVREFVPTVPCIVVTRAPDAETAVACLKAGAYDYVPTARLDRLGPAVRQALAEATPAAARSQEPAAGPRSERPFRLLVENALDILTILDRDGTIRYESPSVTRLLGYRPEELVGQHVWDFIHPDDLPDLIRIAEQHIAIPGAAPPVEFRWRHKDGSWRILEAVGNNRLDDPAVAGVVVSSRDLTAQRRVEQALRAAEEQVGQLQRLETMGRVAGGVIHDLNNLLTPILSYSCLLRDSAGQSDPSRKYVEEICQAAERATELTRQLLAINGSDRIARTTLDLNVRVRAMEKLFRHLLGENIELFIVLDLELGPVRANGGQFVQVLLNLVVNARDAMPRGGKLLIETAGMDLKEPYTGGEIIPPGRYVLLAVTDTGCGIEPTQQAHIFEPFFSTKPPGKGTGLGLATVRQIVTQYGGYVRVQSEPGHGTTFEIYLPRAEGPIEPDAMPARPGGLDYGLETILLIEDDEGVRRVVQDLLRMKGYEVLEAASDEEALKLAERHRGAIHLLLADVVLPGRTARELAPHLARWHPRMRVLYMSGRTDRTLAYYGVAPEEVAFIRKPFTSYALARKVREVLDSSEEERS